MPRLANALKRYYYKSVRKTMFVHGLSLSELAMQMWQELGYHQVDISMLSRVLSGERLFTAKQLKIFCSVLKLSHEDFEFLLHCLVSDQCERKGVKIDPFYLPRQEVVELLNLHIASITRADPNDDQVHTILNFLQQAKLYMQLA